MFWRNKPCNIALPRYVQLFRHISLHWAIQRCHPDQKWDGHWGPPLSVSVTLHLQESSFLFVFLFCNQSSHVIGAAIFGGEIQITSTKFITCLFYGCILKIYIPRSLFLCLYDEILQGMFEAENEVGYCTRFREI